MIKEERVIGFHVIKCKKCGRNKSYFNKEDDPVYCPACGTNDVDILKTIYKEDNVYINKSSVKTYFNY